LIDGSLLLYQKKLLAEITQRLTVLSDVIAQGFKAKSSTRSVNGKLSTVSVLGIVTSKFIKVITEMDLDLTVSTCGFFH
jgi:hypothetical protein